MRYDESVKVTALAALAANSDNISLTARQLNMPERTLNLWAHKDDRFSAKCEAKKKNLADKLDDIAHAIADAMPDKIEKAGLQQAATSLGIAIDKARLLRGESTSITENLSSKEAEFIETVQKMISSRHEQNQHLTINQIIIQVREELTSKGLGSLLRLLPDVTEG